MFKKLSLYAIVLTVVMNSCSTKKKDPITRKNIQFVTVDPGHFHAALVQKANYNEVDSTIYIYAPSGEDVALHLNRINGFNERKENPTHWNSILYTGGDFFKKMLSDKNGNVVVLAGNNQKKTEYINQAIDAGLNVLADKPMVINISDFELLKKTFEIAKKNEVLLYDIMTERFEITSLIQKKLVNNSVIFGELQKGTAENPAIVKESVHHFFKYVSGNILTRPPWFFDVEQEGEGIVDVTTHLVDLVQWQCFPERTINYNDDIEVYAAERDPTFISQKEFEAVTKLKDFPEYLQKYMANDTTIAVFCNGEINYKLKGIHTKVSVRWNYVAPEGTGDTHYSVIRGTNANLTIKQGAAQNYKTSLYIEAINLNEDYKENVNSEFAKLVEEYPGIVLQEIDNGWEVIIPEKYKEGHEAHFAQVTEKYLEYLINGNMPEWEIPNMIAKYYTTTKALELSREK